jgi:hypothetical protein
MGSGLGLAVGDSATSLVSTGDARNRNEKL